MALPAPTALTPTQRYIPAGVRRFTWVPTIANKAAPTLAELSAGTDLTADVSAVAGFTTTSGTVTAQDYGTRFSAEVSGLITVAASSITTYLSENSTDARSLLVRDTAGFVVIYPEGIVTSGKCSVFPVTVTTSSVQASDAPGNAATLVTEFVVTSEPVENIAIPTA